MKGVGGGDGKEEGFGVHEGVQRAAHPVIGLAVNYHLRNCD
jgi:hypothetical protein